MASLDVSPILLSTASALRFSFGSIRARTVSLLPICGYLRLTCSTYGLQTQTQKEPGVDRIDRSDASLRRDNGDLDQEPRIGEFGLDAGAAGQILPAGPGVPGLVHRVAQADVGDPDGGAHDVALVGAAQRQQPIDLSEDLLGLSLRILLRIIGGDPGGEHEAVRLDRLRVEFRWLVALDRHRIPPAFGAAARAPVIPWPENRRHSRHRSGRTP